jgi:lipid A ethanolaminephosphotransferase
LGSCDRDAITNAYDNTLLYTDHVLAEQIKLLAGVSERLEVMMLYASDHGESLGEGGMYLHGLPYVIAPRSQTHVPLFIWAPDLTLQAQRLSAPCLRQRSQMPASHDNLFHTTMGFFGLQGRPYTAALDLLQGCKEPS